MSDDFTVRVAGLPGLNRALKQVSAESSGALKAGMLRITERVAGKVRGKVPRGKTGRAQGSVKARASTQGGRIAFGGTAAPHFPWLDFGGSTGRGHKPRVPWSGSIVREWKGNPAGEGRYVYPQIRESGPDIRREVDDLLVGLARGAGFDTQGRP